MKRASARRILAACVAASILVAPAALSQTPPAAPTASDRALAAQKAAFLALPEATRKAAQDALVWLGLYNGVVDGDFGKRTRDSILAFQTSMKASADGALSADELQALLGAAQTARDAVGFQVVNDPKTGARIGAPAKLLGPRGDVRLDFSSAMDADLGALYARLAVETATRKLAYKAMKPDGFFVVSGQDGATKFYTRFDKNPDASPPIRGFTFSYPAAQAARLDRIAIAVANSFEPFPAPAAPAEASGSGAKTPAPGPVLTATALVVAPGKALTALKPDECANASVAGKPVRFERVDAATGLVIIAGDFGSTDRGPRLGALTPDLVALGFGEQGLAASSASLAGDEARPLIVAAVETSASGAPVFDRRGALVGLVTPLADEPKRVAGVALAAPHAMIGPESLRAFLGGGEAAAPAPAALSVGDIAAGEKDALLAVFCEK